MGRHATVAGRQAQTAAAKGKAFTRVAREITVAARSGGDPSKNSRLRMAIEKARDVNMPKDNIERAIKKGTGELAGENLEEVTYEGYGPANTAIMVECLTDNKNRANGDLHKTFTKNGGNLGGLNSVGWMFKRKGVIDISSSKASEDKIMEIALDAGAEDIQSEGTLTTVYTDIASFNTVRDALIQAQIQPDRSGLELIAENRVSLKGEDAKRALDFVAALEELDDIQNVYHNFDISQDELSKIM